MPAMVAMEAATAVDVSSYTTAITGALTDFSVGNLQTILFAALGITVGLGIFWFGYRFIKRKVIGAMKKGTI